MTTIVPPHADITLELVTDDDVIDINQIFLARLLTAGPLRPSGDRTAALLLRAGRSALRNDGADLSHRLRGLGAVLAGSAGAGDGVRLRLDDLELAEGSTQRSADVLRACAAPAPYDDAVDEAVGLVGPDREVTLVIERDQQLPAALRLAGKLAGGRTRITGWFATAHWEALSALPAFADARLAPSRRGLQWRTIDPFGTDGVPSLPWKERAADTQPPQRWAGRVSLGSLAAARDAHTVIIGLCATPRAAVGRGGSTMSWSRFSTQARRLSDSGTRVLAELWVGAPGIDLADAPAGLQAVSAVVDRVVGLRVFDWLVGWSDPRWAGEPVQTVPADDDLVRHRTMPQQPTAARLTDVVASLGKPLARADELVPGRVAATYLVSPRPSADGGLRLDPDVVLGARNSGTGRGIAVNLRTGVCTPTEDPVTGLIAARATPADARRVLSALPAGVLAALRDRDVVAGAA